LGYERRRGNGPRVSFEVDCFSISKSREETEDSVGIPVEGRKWEERVLGTHRQAYGKGYVLGNV